jgi:DNA-binding transcriptional MerR regulator
VVHEVPDQAGDGASPRPGGAGPGEQAALFPDASLPDELVGYRGAAACQIAGITYRQLDYWARTGLVAPSIRTAHGSGSQRLYSFKDILVLKVVKRLLDTGVSLQNIRVAVDHLRRRGVADLARITLFSDGTTVYECTSPEEVVDLLHDPRVPGRTGRRRRHRAGPGGRTVPPPQGAADRLEDCERSEPVLQHRVTHTTRSLVTTRGRLHR